MVESRTITIAEHKKLLEKSRNFGCPLRHMEIVARTSMTVRCNIPGKDLCVSQEYLIENCEECSYYLFPEPLCKNYIKKECVSCPCDKFEQNQLGEK